MLSGKTDSGTERFRFRKNRGWLGQPPGASSKDLPRNHGGFLDSKEQTQCGKVENVIMFWCPVRMKRAWTISLAIRATAEL